MFRKAVFIFSIVIASIIATHTTIASDTKIVQKSIPIYNIKPMYFNGTEYIALRPVFEALEWKVTWNSFNKSISCDKGKDSLTFNAAKNIVNINKQVEFMSAPLLIYKNSSYLPTRFIVDQFGLKIRWTGKDNIIITNSWDAVNASINGKSNIIISGNGLILNIFEPCSSETINDMASYADNLLSHDNLEDAMSKYSEILENISSEDMPDMYARITNNLANTLCKLAEWDNSIDYMDKAIPMYLSALAFYESIKDGDNIHIIKNNLGMLHLKLYELTGNETSKSNALSLFKESLDYYSDQWPLEHSIIQYNIGTILKEDSPNESRDYFEKSKRIFIKKLDSLDLKEENPLYAMICYNIGNIYGNEGSAESLKISLNYFDEALKFWTLEKQPLQYANLHMSMGQIYKYLYQLDHSTNSLEKAIENYEESLKIYTFKKYPLKYAQIKYNLGNIYGSMSESGDYPSMVKAESSFEDCLKFFTEDEYPYYHKKVQSLINSLTKK